MLFFWDYGENDRREQVCTVPIFSCRGAQPKTSAGIEERERGREGKKDRGEKLISMAGSRPPTSTRIHIHTRPRRRERRVKKKEPGYIPLLLFLLP